MNEINNIAKAGLLRASVELPSIIADPSPSTSDLLSITAHASEAMLAEAGKSFAQSVTKDLFITIGRFGSVSVRGLIDIFGKSSDIGMAADRVVQLTTLVTPLESIIVIVGAPFATVPDTFSPTLSVSPTSGYQRATFYYTGSNYTANDTVEWHVRKPDGTEYPPAELTGNVDGSGNFSYTYLSTCSSATGTHTIWAFDKFTGRRSNDVMETIIASSSCLTPVNPSAGISMAAQGKTAYENQTLSLTVSSGQAATISFSAARSSDSDGTVVSYQWYISGTPRDTTRDFTFGLGAGTHQIYLEVWDNSGAKGAVGATVIVTAASNPTLTIEGGTSSTKQQLSTYSLAGSNYTANFTVTRYLQFPDGHTETMSPTLSANASSQISWSYTSQCGTPLGTYNIWVRDDSNGRTSGTVQEIVTSNPSCTP